MYYKEWASADAVMPWPQESTVMLATLRLYTEAKCWLASRMTSLTLVVFSRCNIDILQLILSCYHAIICYLAINIKYNLHILFFWILEVLCYMGKGTTVYGWTDITTTSIKISFYDKQHMWCMTVWKMIWHKHFASSHTNTAWGNKTHTNTKVATQWNNHWFCSSMTEFAEGFCFYLFVFQILRIKFERKQFWSYEKKFVILGGKKVTTGFYIEINKTSKSVQFLFFKQE